MYRIAISNQKGGVGKTTDAICLAGALADAGHDVLAADLDPQGWLTIRLGLQEAYEAEPPSLMNGMMQPREHDAHNLIVEHEEFDVLPSNVDMFTLEKQLIGSGRQPNQRLRILLEDIDEDEYDFLVVDAPPSLGPINDSVLIATERVVIPVKADRLSRLAIDHLLNQIESIENHYGLNIDIAGVLVSDVDYPLDNSQEDALEWFRDTFSMAPVEVIRHRVGIERSLDKGGSIFGDQAEDVDQREPFERMAMKLANSAGVGQ